MLVLGGCHAYGVSTSLAHPPRQLGLIRQASHDREATHPVIISDLTP